ncbi:MAG: EAL domain-containing protein [Rhodococcus sp. (in: high G+C Gram-positive bacteria)]
MFRSRNERQSESARKYLDFAAVSPALENAVEVTAHALGYPIALVNILDDKNQHTLVAYGSDDARGGVVPLSRSACREVVDSGRPIIVQDAAVDATVDETDVVHPVTANEDRVDVDTADIDTADIDTADVDTADVDTADVDRVDVDTATAGPVDTGRPTGALLAALRKNGFRSYAAIPLFGRESVPIGTLCLLDTRPHVISPDKFRLFEQLAVMVEEHLDFQRDRTRVAVASASVAELTAAVDDGQITPWYEPIVDLRSGSVHALEALARWAHPTRGLVPPGAFIEQMENTDLIVDLDLHILDRALSDFGKWIVEYPDLKLSVNISGHHLERPDCVERIVRAVDASSVAAESVVLEITETARGIGVRREARIVDALRAEGFTVMLDDLGSGWSPIPRLTQMSIDGFKLDRSVAAALHTKIGDAMAHAMVHFAGELGHSVVLEGLENRSRLERATRLGFEYGQGHCFSKAVAAEDVAQLLADRQESGWLRIADGS